MSLEQYKGYQIITTAYWYRDFDGFTYAVHISKMNSNKISFTEIHQITNLAIITKYGRGDSINQIVESETISNALSAVKLRIDFQQFEMGAEFLTCITSSTLNDIKEQKSDDEIQLFLLKGLFTFRKNNPTSYKFNSFDPKGICQILNISNEIYEYNADLLVENGYINTSLDNGIAMGQLYITSSGINKIQEQPINKTTIDKTIINNIMQQNNITNSGDGNLFNTGDNNRINQTVTIEKGNFEQLKQSLLDNGIGEAEIIELEQIIDTDIPTYTEKKFGTKVNSWIQKMMGKALDGSWQIGVGAAGGVLSELFMKYYGM